MRLKVYQPELLEHVSTGEGLEAGNELHQYHSLLICNGV